MRYRLLRVNNTSKVCTKQLLVCLLNHRVCRCISHTSLACHAIKHPTHVCEVKARGFCRLPSCHVANSRSGMKYHYLLDSFPLTALIIRQQSHVPGGGAAHFLCSLVWCHTEYPPPHGQREPIQRSPEHWPPACTFPRIHIVVHVTRF